MTWFLIPIRGSVCGKFPSHTRRGNIYTCRKGLALGRKAWLFAGSQRGGQRAAFMCTLIVTVKMNDIDQQAWLADVLARLPDGPVSRLHELPPWNWKSQTQAVKAA